MDNVLGKYNTSKSESKRMIGKYLRYWLGNFKNLHFTDTKLR